MFRRILLTIFLGIVFVGLVALGLAIYGSRDLDPSELEARYTNETSRFVTVDGVRFHLQETGTPSPDQPSLVLIHGFGAHLQTWDAWVAGLEDQFHIVRFDLPGHGLTGPDPSGDYSNDRTVEILSKLMDEIDLGQIVPVGNSLGGLLAWRLADAYPERVAAQVLIAPGGVLAEGAVPGEAGDVPAWFGFIRFVLPKAMIRGLLDSLYGDKSRITPDLVTRYHEMLRRKGNREALLTRMRGFVLARPEPVLQGIDVPSLVIWGTEDRILPLEQAEVFDANLPDVKTVDMEGVGHMPMEEAPAASLAIFRQFWDKVASQTLEQAVPPIADEEEADPEDLPIRL